MEKGRRNHSIEVGIETEMEKLEISEEHESRRIMEEKIIEALKNGDINRIGICGPVGVDNTRMACQIGAAMKKERLLKLYKMVRVGPNPNLSEIRHKIGIRLVDGKASVARVRGVLPRCYREEKTMIILLDVGEVFDMRSIGIPLQEDYGLLKVIMTSRSSDICSAMGCQRIFTVQALPRGYSDALKGKVGDSVEQDFDGASCSFRDIGYEGLYKRLEQSIQEVNESVSPLPRQNEQVFPATGASVSHLAVRNQDSGDDMSEKSFFSTTSENMIREEVTTGLSENYELAPREERWDGNSLQGYFSVDVIADGKGDDDKLLGDLTLFCSVFPFGYEFTKDIIVWQWVAGEFMNLREDEVMEEIFCRCFDRLLRMDYIEACGYDLFLEQMKYKVGDKLTTYLRNQLLEPKFQKDLDNKQIEVAKVEHLCLAFQQIDRMKIEMVKQCNCLQTLIIYHCHDFGLIHLPSDFFLEFKALKILNFSCTNIVGLPSSVENLKELQFLDMSQTPICWLPETIRFCRSLKTLKLDGCLDLRGLPECTSDLTSLRHLVLDVVRQLQSMPIRIGKLSKLRTLRAFLVGEDDGCRISELKDMNKLSGSFRIVNLENVMSKEEAEEACLFHKQDLKKIELRWSDLQDEENRDEEEILEYLRPHYAIQELNILFYSGRVFPSWISNPLFCQLDKIILHRCRYCSSLPSLGELPSLKHLSIIENNKIKEIDSIFCKKQSNKHHVAFPKLEKLSFESMSKLERWTGLEKDDFPSLRHLIIEDCPNFVSLPFLSQLNSLLHLKIIYCPELSCLPEDGLPSNLEFLMIKACPKLSARCCNERCEDWCKVASVPDFYIDNQWIFPEFCSRGSHGRS